MAFVADNKHAILAIIDGWSGKLSDELLSKKIQDVLGLDKPPSRHTLAKHPEVKHAIDLKRKELRDKKNQSVEQAKQCIDSGDKLSQLMKNLGSEESTIKELIKLVEALENDNKKLSSEKKRLEAINAHLQETFVRWQYNLQRMDGVDLNLLMARIDEGLPAKNRD